MLIKAFWVVAIVAVIAIRLGLVKLVAEKITDRMARPEEPKE